MKITEIHENDLKHHRQYLIGAEIDKCDLHDSYSVDGYKAGHVWAKGEYHFFSAVKVEGYEEVQRELETEKEQ